tara:strand:+ start:227 stop:451 length:225 start_codon:yes stop_codon:yes gene_type:complete
MNDDAFLRFMNDYRDYLLLGNLRTRESYEEAYYEYYAWKHRSLDKDVHELALNYQASEQRTPTDIHQLILNLED